jgi:ElaA protein
MDDKDQGAWHLTGWFEDRLVAYTRLLPPGLTYEEASIGRVVSSPSVRRMGFGRELMEVSIQQLWHLFGKQNIRIGAQLYLEAFYSSFGFVPQGEEYIEDDIPHIKMLLSI